MVFGFVATSALGLFLLVCMLPKALDSPPTEDDPSDGAVTAVEEEEDKEEEVYRR